MATYKPDSRGRCPYCLTVVRFGSGCWLNPDPIRRTYPDIPDRPDFVGWRDVLVSSDSDANKAECVLQLTAADCPECRKLILTIGTGKWMKKSEKFVAEKEFVVWPLQSARPPVPDEVPPHIAADYKEAALVLNLSPKASAALSRRCLQALLREVGSVNQCSLSKQIAEVMPNLPSWLAEDIDAIRNIGNFAAHPIKDQNSGQIVDVEPGEAEWNLEVLDRLFDFYYVQPALSKQRRDALDAKLAAADKPPMK